MSRFRHPYLTRGIVHTAMGAFAVCRGIIEAPDAIGEELGWLRIPEEHVSTAGVVGSGEGIPPTSARIAAYA